MKAKSIWMMALWVAGLGAGSAIVGCEKGGSHAPAVSAADKTETQKVASDRAAADMAAADKAAAVKAVTDKAAADKSAAVKAVTDKAAADKALADKAAADKAVADKVAAEKAATQEMAEASALPPDLVEMKAEITRMTAQIDVTIAKLETLCVATGDLEKPTESALAAIEALDAEAQVIKKRGDQMRDRGAAYFEVWEKQLTSISTPEVAEIATKRKDELAANYADVLTSMQETRAAMDAFWADLGTIRKVLEEDVTPESQKLLAPQVKVAKEKAATVKSRIETTFGKVGQVSLIYTKR